ncbi:MAG: MucBP domain-containing protein [Limosilactobacillus sp.]|uniref:MucBP domain-containing protein n=1 Tax=Limosilactobacillus sp. TaxID=2773925 RepID=UPI00270F3AE9|nr:MucBP domain-containing protein [Limosilactobacillus sp.]
MLEKLKNGNPIWIYYIDIDTGENLMVPQLMKGIIPCKYHVEKKEFPRYTFVKSEGQMDGTFDMKRKEVRLYYRKDNWKDMTDVDLYLHLDKPAPVYDMVDGMPVGDPALPGIVVKAFRKVVTKDGQTWYDIGADQWVKYDGIRVVNEPFQNDHYHSVIADQLTILPLKNVKGKIDYLPGKEVDVFDKPYGQKVGSVADGKEVEISGQLNDNGEITWYEIGDHQFVTGNYVIIDEDE